MSCSGHRLPFAVLLPSWRNARILGMATPDATLWLGAKALPWLPLEGAAARPAAAAAAEQPLLMVLTPPEALRACCGSGCCADAPRAALLACWAATAPDAAPPVGPADGPAPLPAAGLSGSSLVLLIKEQIVLFLANLQCARQTAVIQNCQTGDMKCRIMRRTS